MKKLILLSFLLWVGLITGLPETGLSRQKRQSGRANVQGCTMTPSGIDNILTPAKENAIISVTCTTDTAPDSCVFQHAAPMDVGLVTSAGGSAANDQYNTKCTATLQTNGQTCPDDSRITYVMTSTSCGFRISKAEPDDTGRWILTVSEAMASGSMVDNTKTVTIYTFNRTLTDITDDRDSLITRNVDAWFNYDDNEEEWRAGSIGGWEQVELNCNARGGRPEPKIRWYINNDDRNAFGGESGSSDADKVFSVRESYGTTYDDEGYIRDKISQLIFDVDRDLLNYLWEKNQINSNPTTGQFTFDLVCEVNQGDYGMEKISTTITIKRIYFEDRLKTSTIGWIVGGVLVGILLILIILVALWAKASGRWCFEDDEYSYGNPNDPKRRPRTQAQVYSAEDTDSSGPVKAMRYAPTAPSRTTTTLVGQVQGSPAPTPNTQGPLFIKNKNQVRK
ncbi:uncharacterized protein LOC111702790 isoform X2 [Eurytemora carolleeae]|uniref:uncharacterized protein LOC111702790 isoform X2 n=1 Tax=Eurytemora carolleeae TaxID=1294199 RepID=UPI000C77DA52|nr:uncharacterized protein LOC111702790 isoform X2 [Eurytemora carolleeae]|eukprot:XP_023330333.1 uncharacterized protein LOC111702790 isoform X2 [Eurytemora affinis]